ncbi:MAG: ABC transporter permease subunit, partial [Bacteroidota bacterium]
MSRRLSLLLLVPVALVLVGYVLLPAWETVRLSIEDGTLWRLFEDGTSGAAWRGLVTSVGVSLVSVLLSGILGTGLAFAFYRFDFPMRRLLGTAALVPLALPPLVGVLAFLFLYGESGILPRLIQTVFSLDEVPFAFEGLSAVVIVHVYAFYVYFFLFVGAGFESLDASLLEASSDLGAPGWTTFRRVVLPALGPALLSASLLVFMVSMASFTAPLLFANGEEFLTLQIYRAKTNGDLALS